MEFYVKRVSSSKEELKHSDDELQHHGILGMKWGIRRYQNKDGSYTKEGKERYGRRRDAIESIGNEGVNKKESPVYKDLNSISKQIIANRDTERGRRAARLGIDALMQIGELSDDQDPKDKALQDWFLFDDSYGARGYTEAADLIVRGKSASDVKKIFKKVCDDAFKAGDIFDTSSDDLWNLYDIVNEYSAPGSRKELNKFIDACQEMREFKKSVNKPY